MSVLQSSQPHYRSQSARRTCSARPPTSLLPLHCNWVEFGFFGKLLANKHFFHIATGCHLRDYLSQRHRDCREEIFILCVSASLRETILVVARGPGQVSARNQFADLQLPPLHCIAGTTHGLFRPTNSRFAAVSQVAQKSRGNWPLDL